MSLTNFHPLRLYTCAAFMLSTQLNSLAEENKLAPNCICILKKHVTNILKDGRCVHCILTCYGFVAVFGQ